MSYLSLIAGLFLVILLIVTPLTIESQLLFGVVAILISTFLMFNYKASRKFIFAALVIVVSGRYMYWRVTETMGFSSGIETALGWGMFAAEIYFLIILAGSYVQNIYMRERKPIDLPDDRSKWPTIDVYIPTYNEPLDMVEVTVVAAKGIDWPGDKIKVYLLDDGKRKDFEEMANTHGIEYIARKDNKGAKAGNLNNAMKITNGELIAIFDCDHVPTRSFLQTTIGWFIRDKKLGLMQTPHHFYNDDPFEKNLLTGNDSPNEGLLFYGLVQDGNDFWNASFFCGSCAILRRKALEEVGGVATETVTEDAHTSLRMHQKGWNSAYLKMPQASGLATGSLRDHVGQRLRWGRGMVQIFRTENPFIIPSLSFAQRFCYANAMLHFLFPLPRIVLLTAPLAYLFLDVHIIVASPQAVVAYALPHIIVAIMASFYMQSRFRQLFTTEVYETSLAFHLIGPILLTLINPRLGKFNVTNKDSNTNDTYFDWKIVLPQLMIIAILGSSVIYAIADIFSINFTGDAWTSTLNIFWASISILFLTLSVAVALEKRERRANHRINVNLPIVLQANSGHCFNARLSDMSLGGACVSFSDDSEHSVSQIPIGSTVYMSVPYSHSSIIVEGTVLRHEKNDMHLNFANQENVAQLRNKVRAIFGRADAWADWDQVPQNGIIVAGRDMIKSTLYLIGWFVRNLFTSNKKTANPQYNADHKEQNTDLNYEVGNRSLSSLGTTNLVVIMALFIFGSTLIATPGIAIAEKLTSVQTIENDRFLMTRDYSFQLKDVGVVEPILLQGGDSSRAFSFSLRSDEVVTSANMKLLISVSPGLDPQNSQLAIVINGETVHSMLLNTEQNGINEIDFSLSPYVMLQDNSLEFRVLARKLGQEVSDRKVDKSVWVQISNASKLSLNVNRIPSAPDLNNLPAPFFDKRDHAELNLPFVFSSSPTRTAVQSALVVGSYWGSLASFRRASFPVYYSSIPTGNAVVFMTNTSSIDGIENVAIDGPSLEIITNPRDVLGQLLIVKGRDDKELLIAARALSVGKLLVSGNAIDVSEPIQQPRDYYDAPSWLPANRPITFGEIEETAELEGYGLSPGLITVNFKMAPDIFLWSSDGIPVNLNFRHPGEKWFDLENSRLDVLINDKFVESIPLVDTAQSSLSAFDSSQANWKFTIPPYLIYGENKLQFYFDLKTKVSEQNYHLLPGQVRVAIGSDSSIDMSSVYRYARMPNLAYLAQSGLPFSRKADLSETAVVVPEGEIDKYSLQALINFVATISSKTGYSAFGIEVINAQMISNYHDHDILLLGNFDNQPLIDKWSESSSLNLNGSYVSVASQPIISRYKYKFNNYFSKDEFNPDQIVLPKESMSSALFSYKSPMNDQRTVVGLVANNSEDLVKLVEAIKSREMSSSIKGDFFVLNDKEVLSFTTSEPYFVGHLPWYIHVQWYISSNAWLMPPLLTLGVLLLALASFSLARAKSKKHFAQRDIDIAAGLEGS